MPTSTTASGCSSASCSPMSRSPRISAACLAGSRQPHRTEEQVPRRARRPHDRGIGPSRRCAPSSPGPATPRPSPMTTRPRPSVWRIRAEVSPPRTAQRPADERPDKTADRRDRGEIRRRDRSGQSMAKSPSTANTRLVMSSEVRPTSRRLSRRKTRDRSGSPSRRSRFRRSWVPVPRRQAAWVTSRSEDYSRHQGRNTPGRRSVFDHQDGRRKVPAHIWLTWSFVALRPVNSTQFAGSISMRIGKSFSAAAQIVAQGGEIDLFRCQYGTMITISCGTTDVACRPRPPDFKLRRQARFRHRPSVCRKGVGCGDG